ncbi:MAG TPA: hypothetical protein VHF47_06655, partial [Acidimicrobiales bacterium]|nr:hypothetical protein [Acidimicrobiales bacterium]
GTRLCVEVNNPGGSNIVGIDVGWGLWTTPMLSGPGFAVFLDVCGHPTETTCTTVVQPTGADVTPGDGPDTNPFTTTCIATVASLCIGAPLLEYGKSGDPTVVVVVNGTPIPVNLTYNCVTVPGVPCP